mmetsp:Transcript_14984/g.53970  ORF Transcript_14984/g.53970 Transcript_14984/m.53970 type:complete len:290 (-) Transcript_14984:46-915(-)
MFTTQTNTHTTAITFDKSVPNSSSFFFSGVISSSAAASVIASRIFPIAVFNPVPTTTPRHRPTVTTVPLYSMHVLSCTTAFALAHGVSSLDTDPLSPVRMLWSTRNVDDAIDTSRTSAGTLFPTTHSTTSPGTSSAAGNTFRRPDRSTVARLAWYALSSSIARSAFVSVSTPTVAFATRMRTMTPGSTNAPEPSPSTTPKTNDTTAAAMRIFTRRSSNCFNTSFQNGVPSSGGISFAPCLARSAAASRSDNPTAGSTPQRARTSETSRACASSMMKLGGWGRSRGGGAV